MILELVLKMSLGWIPALSFDTCSSIVFQFGVVVAASLGLRGLDVE